MGDVTAPDERHWQQLATYVTQRRTQLRLTQAQVQAAGGPSAATVRLIESAGQTSYRPAVLAALESALRWPEGTIERILNGGEPIASPPRHAPPDREDLEHYEARLVEIRDDPDRSAGIRTWAGSLVDQIARLYAADEEESQRRAG